MLSAFSVAVSSTQVSTASAVISAAVAEGLSVTPTALASVGMLSQTSVFCTVT